VRAEHQERLAASLLEHPCVECGEADLRVLDLDHEDPADKAGDVGRFVTLVLPWSTVLAEIECSVRCANGHRRRTADAFGRWRASAEAHRRDALHERSTIRLSALLGPGGGSG